MVKSVLALSILATTGVVTQAPVQAAESVQLEKISQEKLKTYYSQTPVELKNQKASWDTKLNRLGINFGNKGEERLAQVETNHKQSGLVNAFLVDEDLKTTGSIYSIGGITEPNKGAYYDYLANPQVTIVKAVSDTFFTYNVNDFKLYNEQISVKELDFKLRKLSIENYGLYNTHNSGTIVIKTSDQSELQVKLDEKASKEQMNKVIDAKVIVDIKVYLNK